MNVGFIGDLHIDYNVHHDFFQALERVVQTLALDYLVFCGDTTTGAFQALDFYDQLKGSVAPCQILAIPGNHELYCLGEKKAKDTFFCMDADDYQNLLLMHQTYSLYLHPIVSKDWIIIGGPSWYDYSLHNQYELMSERKRHHFLTKNPEYKYIQDSQKDTYINERITQKSLVLLEKQLATIRASKNGREKQICSVIHMLPLAALYPKRPIFNTTIAFMGSKHYGELYDKYQVRLCICAHSHQRMTLDKKETRYVNVSLGHNFKWLHKTNLYQELLSTLYVLNLDHPEPN